VIVRPKTAADAEELLALAYQVQRHSGYPRYLPDDLAGFITPGSEDVGWVAESNGHIVGHVGLHTAAGHPTLPAAQRATGLGPERLAVLARLLVAPELRRQGIAQQLIAVVLQYARDRDQRVVLDVVKEATAPILLYEDLGWTRLEDVQLPLRGGRVLDMWVYLSPPPSREL
jgi:GNAT superfamily N-acetyltransferase